MTLLALIVLLATTPAALAQEPVEDEAQSLPAGSRAMLEAAPSLPPPAETDDQLRSILAQDEFQQEAGEPRAESLWSRFLTWLNSLFSRAGLATGSWYGTVAILALTLLLIFLAVRMLWQLASRRRTHEARQVPRGEEHMTADDMIAAAEKAARAGNHRSAIRLRFLALLRRLAEPGLALTTNHQLTRRVTKRYPSLNAPFRELVLCYEDAWYGGMPCGAADYTRARELAERVAARVTEEAGDERPGQ